MNKALIKLNSNIPIPVGSIDAYLSVINRIPLLTAEEEYEYAVRLREHNDLEAARQLVMSHLRFVARIARGYLGYGLALADLIQEGNIGLMKAVKRFDPYMKVRLVTFAVHWIKAEIHEFILRNWRIVKVATTKAQRKLFFNLRSAKKRLTWLNKAEIDAVAKDLGVKAKDILDMEERLNAHDVSFNATNEEDEEDDLFAPEHYLEAENADPALTVENANSSANSTEGLQYALATLDDRSRDIVASRWLGDNKATLHDLAAKYKVSAERVRQLEENAMRKLKGILLAPAV